MTVAYRSALVGTIYMKTLRLSSVSAREVGQVSSRLLLSLSSLLSSSRLNPDLSSSLRFQREPLPLTCQSMLSESPRL